MLHAAALVIATLAGAWGVWRLTAAAERARDEEPRRPPPPVE